MPGKLLWLEETKEATTLPSWLLRHPASEGESMDPSGMEEAGGGAGLPGIAIQI